MTTRVSELANGLKIATRSMPHATTLSVGIWVNAGARDEGDHEQGIAHMLEHMAFKGTKRRDAQAIACMSQREGTNSTLDSALLDPYATSTPPGT